MKKQLTIILFSLILISLINAIDIFTGELYPLNLTEDYDYYSIVGNETEVDLTIVGEYPDYFMIVNKYNPSVNFTLVFFNKEKEIIYQTSSGGGGGSSGGSKIIYRDKNVTNYQTIETPGETTTEIVTETTTETIETNKIPTWAWIVIIILVCILLFLIVLMIKTGDYLN